jgi:hypothetical protein
LYLDNHGIEIKNLKEFKMSLYGQLIKQEADYTTLVDEKLAEAEKLIQVIN